MGQPQDTIHLIIGDRQALISNENVEISGVIKRKGSGEKLIGAVIRSLSTGKAGVSNEIGNYLLQLRRGPHLLSVTSLGFAEVLYKLEIFKSGTLDIELEEKEINLNQIEIVGSRTDKLNEPIGLELLDVKKLDRQSKFLGETDVLRSLQSLTGVSSIGEGSSGINVRGGNTDENLILQDQHLILNPTHALGIFSLTHPDLIDQLSLFKGNMPAKYGGRLSSVLEIKLREGDLKSFKGNLGVGLASSRFSLEGPLIRDKFSFIAGFRGSYLDWLLDLSRNVNLKKSSALFYDGTLKIDGRITPSTKVGISLFSTQDNFRFTDEVKFDYQTRSAVAYLRQLIGPKVNIAATVNMGSYDSNLYDIKSNDQSRFKTNIGFLRLIGISQLQVNPKYFIEAGVEIARYDILPGSIEPYGEGSSIGHLDLKKEQSNELNLFIQNRIKIFKKLEVELGLRQTFYKSLGPTVLYRYQEGKPKTDLTIIDSTLFGEGDKIKAYSGLEPRISFNFSLTPSIALKGGYNKSFQYLNQMSNTSSASPTDLWQLSNYYISPQRADNFSAGYYQKVVDKSIDFSINVFYKWIKNLIDYKDFAVVLMNNHIESDLLRGKGKSYGLEMYYQKQMEKSSMEFSYTYSRSLRKVEETLEQESINKGNWFPSNYDKPHVLNANYFFLLSSKTNLSLNFTYSTGRPTSAPIGVFNQENLYDIPIYSSRNQFRIPDYHRLDVSYSIGPWGKKTIKHSLALSIYNVYSRNNAYSVFFRQNAFLQTSTYRISVLGAAFPSIAYNLKF